MKKQLTAGSICRHEPETIFRRHDLSEAARRMRENHVGTLVVIDETDGHRRAIGMLTDRDIVTAVIAKGLDPVRVNVGDVMSQPLVCARRDDSLMTLLQQMRSQGLRRIPVLDDNEHLLGLVSRDDVIDTLSQALSMAAAVVPASVAHERKQRPGPGASKKVSRGRRTGDTASTQALPAPGH